MNVLRQFIYNNRWFLLIALLSLFLKIVLLLQGGVVNPDAATYIAAAEKHSQGLFSEGLHYYRMPFYPLLLAVTHVVIPDWILAGQLLTIIPLVLVLLPLYALTQRLFDRQSALWTILLFAVLPEFNTVAIMRDPLFLLFTLGALYYLVSFYQQKQVTWIIGFCLLSLLAILIRIEGVLLFLIATIPIFFYWWYSKKLKGNQTSAFICLTLFFSVIAAVLWGVNVVGFSTKLRLNEVTRWGSDLLSLDFFSGYQLLMESIKNLQHSLPVGHLRNNLLELTRHYAPLIYFIGLFEVLATAVFPTSLLAFWAYRWREKKLFCPDRWLILLPWAAFILLNLLFLMKRNFIQTRYFWIPIVLSLPWVGFGTSVWWECRQTRKLVVIIVVTMIFIAPLSKTLAVTGRSKDLTIISVGRWLQDYDPQQQKGIFFNDRLIALYAGRTSDVSRVHTVKQIRSLLRKGDPASIIALRLIKEDNHNVQFDGFTHVSTYGDGGRVFMIFTKGHSASLSK